MRNKIVLCLFAVSITLLSCNSSKIKKQAEQATRDFFAALKEDNSSKMLAIYPGFKNFQKYYKSDSIRIYSVVKQDSIVKTYVHSRFSNSFGKTFEQDAVLFFRVEGNGKISLFDSKGLTDFSEDHIYSLAVKIGCVDTKIDTTDQVIIVKMKKSKPVIYKEVLSLYSKLLDEFRITDWNWQIGYGGYASGRGIIYNGSDISVDKLKYKVTYTDGQGNTVTTDGGYLAYDTFAPGDSKSFTVYTSYVGSARSAKVEPVFEEDVIFECLSGLITTGNECTEYYKTHTATGEEK